MRSVHDPAFHGLIGVARTDISPPVGIYARCWGAARHDMPTGIDRPLTATAVAFADSEGEHSCLLIGLDQCAWAAPEVELACRESVAAAAGINSDNVMLNLGHTHAGLAINHPDRQLPGVDMIPAYLEQLKAKLAATGESAMGALAPAYLQWAYGRCSMAGNRDFWVSPEIGYVCGFNPDVPADDQVLVGRIMDHTGTIRGTIVNYACHPTSLGWENELLSPDFPGALRETIELHTGAPCLFLQGASGDLAPRVQYAADPAVAVRNGRQLAFASLAALEGMLPPATAMVYTGSVASGTSLGIWSLQPHMPSPGLAVLRREVELPIRCDLLDSEELAARLKKCVDRVECERLQRKLDQSHWIAGRRRWPIPLWGWRLGEACLIGHPMECYSYFQKTLRERFPGVAIAVMNLVNGCIAYLPPRDVYETNVYQVWQTPFEAGGLEYLTNQASEMIEQLLGHSASDKVSVIRDFGK